MVGRRRGEGNRGTLEAGLGLEERWAGFKVELTSSL